ncbi:hypothetical protein [Leucobacter sp. UCD-THU]|uniref:hypothetical protein n=1 Tax=Leucobacter sp. UCD-THU TaxID=1292023 RepID=UPI0004CEC181|nr:hypothetical protein [Leucobacter sp. UCD-THU]
MKVTRRSLAILIALGLIVTACAAVGVYGLLAGPPKPEHTEQTAAIDSPGRADEDVTSGPKLQPLAETRDPVAFARSIADALFTWDTQQLPGPDPVIEHISAVGDPTGYESPGLYQDLQHYLPTTDQWGQLRDYRTRQSLDIGTARVPDGWNKIASESADELPGGAVAVTVDATRIRSGVWQGEPTRATEEVAFTLFLACPEQTGSCHLLRLSALGSPLR